MMFKPAPTVHPPTAGTPAYGCTEGQQVLPTGRHLNMRYDTSRDSLALALTLLELLTGATVADTIKGAGQAPAASNIPANLVPDRLRAPHLPPLLDDDALPYKALLAARGQLGQDMRGLVASCLDKEGRMSASHMLYCQKRSQRIRTEPRGLFPLLEVTRSKVRRGFFD
jgi:hypothetical protein